MYKQNPRNLAFLLAFSIGVAVLSFVLRQPWESDLPASQVSVEHDSYFAPEFPEIEFDERTGHTSMEMEFVRNGQVARCTSDPAEEEKNWLVLMNRNENFSLEKRVVTYGKPSRTDFGSFSKVKFAESRSAVFMLTNQLTVKPGPVDTVYLGRPLRDDELEANVDSLAPDQPRKFSLGESYYDLRVTAATLKGGQSIYALVLERGSESQIIWFKSSAFSEVIGDLEWVGDLDGDKKLDLLISSFAQNGGQLEGFLFLSSFAIEKNLVGIAGLYSARCTS